MSLRIAVIGLSHGTSHAKVIKGHPRVKLAALVDRDAAKLAVKAADFGVPGFTSVAEMLAAGVADAAVAAVPTPVHAEVTEQLLAAGLHVLQEKPLGRDDADATRIRAAIERAGDRVFQVGYEVRSSALHRTIMEHLSRGDLGPLTNVWYHQHTMDHDANTWRGSRANMGGKLFDCAVHYFDIMQQWAGAPVYRLCAFGNRQGAVGPLADALPDTVTVIVEYANGVRGTYNFGGINSVNDDSNFGLVGTTGRIMGTPWLPDGAGSFELRRGRGVAVSNTWFDSKFTSPGHLGFAEQMDNFAATVLDGAPNVCTFEDAWQLHRQMVAIDQSLASGQPVVVNPL